MAKKKSYGSRFLYAEDMIGHGEYIELTLKITAAHAPNTLEIASGGKAEEYILAFDGTPKLLALNKTNYSVLRFVTGCSESLAEAVGHTIRLAVCDTKMAGEDTIGIRVIPPKGVKIRYNLKKRIGNRAVLEIPKKPEPQSTKPAEQSQFQKLSAKFAEKPVEELSAEYSKMLAFMEDQQAKGFITEDEFEALGKQLNDRLNPPLSTTEEPNDEQARHD